MGNKSKNNKEVILLLHLGCEKSLHWCSASSCIGCRVLHLLLESPLSYLSYKGQRRNTLQRKWDTISYISVADDVTCLTHVKRFQHLSIVLSAEMSCLHWWEMSEDMQRISCWIVFQASHMKHVNKLSLIIRVHTVSAHIFLHILMKQILGQI